MLATFPQARLLMTLGLATVLAVIAVAMLAFSAERRSSTVTAAGVPVVAPIVVTRPAVSATPGSTAHARQTYRASLGR